MQEGARARGPLTGVRVVELGQIAAGPFAGSLLADLGADVVKVERPDGGDGMRQWPPLVDDGSGQTYSGNFASVNRNKRSVAADLKDDDDLALVRGLIGEADAVVENYRPGVLERLGLGYPAMSERHPRLVYCSISGYGQTGPYSGRGAFDVTVQAFSGLMSVTGDPDGPPAKCGVPIADFGAGLYAALCVAACVMEARTTGRGRHIDCSMLGSTLGVAALQTSEYFGNHRDPARLGTAHPRNAPYQGFDTADEMVVVAAGNDDLWARLCRVLGTEELIDDPRFVHQHDRALHQQELADLLHVRFRTQTRDTWLGLLDEAGVPAAPVNTYSQALNDVQVQHLGLVSDMDLPGGASFPTVRFPVGMTEYEPGVRHQPPALGADREEVCRDWGVV